eukprot:TRINITY_DN14787_c0_g3_i1.p1 TRINITY_DN14787_c0_g3~~TRINITY_DN14787_c0_g3_i1.p1  ORF type:complete len:439 (+),score=52.05 TRINITY_DN14787_c0_g3_i1:123-1319(+)
MQNSRDASSGVVQEQSLAPATPVLQPVGSDGHGGCASPVGGSRSASGGGGGIDADEMRARAAARLKAMRRSEDKPQPTCDVHTESTTSAHSVTTNAEVDSLISSQSGARASGGSSSSGTGYSGGFGGNSYSGIPLSPLGAVLTPHSWAWHHSPRSSPVSSPQITPQVLGRPVLSSNLAIPPPCTLTVDYVDGENPLSDIAKLEGGLGKHVLVAAVAPGGKADQAGVSRGQALIAMNGRSNFNHLPGWQVRLLLEAPVTLSFDVAPGDCSISVGRTLDVSTGNNMRQHSAESARVDDVWIVAEQVSFKPTGLHDERSSVNVSCWTPGEDGCTSGGDSGGKNISRPELGPLRWLAPVLGHFLGGTCAQDDSGGPKPNDRESVKVDLDHEDGPLVRRSGDF